ncbi:TPA: DUF551 domain-containing protein [Escherichia coli]|nr:DUF551 domain-containing protein [Escherichia coli]HAM4439003.1 DUF551 domain-containing protein [Escherichia coli]
MTKLTKERLEEIAELARKATYKPCAMHMTNLLVVCDSEVIEEMARQLLASMEQEPVSYTCSDALDDVYCGSAAMMGPAGAVGEVPLYAAPQLPQPAVLSVPDEIPKLKDGMGFKYVKDGVRYSLNYANGWNQCRAAMLQAEPVSNSDELPLDYLQGHKDGLEWAAQLAEANHPQTGDWLYDDPIDLARAIRKGPDMPTVQGGNSPVTPDGWISCSEQMPSAGEQVLAYRPDAPESNDPLIKMATYVGGSAHGHGFDCYCKPTHWMPLPAAPQQEVNRG